MLRKTFRPVDGSPKGPFRRKNYSPRDTAKYLALVPHRMGWRAVLANVTKNGKFSYELLNEQREWLREQVDDRYEYDPCGCFWIENEIVAVAFKLRFG